MPSGAPTPLSMPPGVWRTVVGVAFLLMGVLVGRVWGAVGAELAFKDASRAGGWEMLRVTVAAAGGGGTTVRVQDERGGPVLSRVVLGSGERTVLLPLALVGTEHLPTDVWPVRVSVRSGGAAGAGDGSVVNVARVGEAGGVGRAFRVVTAAREAVDEAALGRMAGRAVAVLRVSADELLHDPALVFAGADAVWLDDATAGQMSSERAAALVNAGLKLIYGGAATPGGELGTWLWVRPGNATGLWVAPAEYESLGPPRVIWDGVRDVRVPRVEAGRGFTAAGLLVTPAAMGAVILVWVFLRRGGWRLLAAGGAVAAVTAGMMGIMHAEVGESLVRYAWTLRHVPGGVVQAETFTARGALFGEKVEAESREAMWPVAGSAAGWLSLSGVEVVLGGEGCRLRAALGSRRVMLLYTRTTARAKALEGEAGAGLPSAGAGWLVEGGYVRRLGAAEGRGEEGQVFPQWLDEQPATAQRVLGLWYALEWEAQRRYVVEVPAGGEMSVVDYGAGTATTGAAGGE